MANGYESNLPTGRPGAPTTLGTVITAGGSAHTLSAAFTDIIASTSFAANRMRVILGGTTSSGTITDMLLNLYTGAASSETLMVSLLAGWSSLLTSGGSKIYDFPVTIPSGTRISSKAQALVASQTVQVVLELWEEGLSCGTAIESLGVDATASRGTAVTPGTTAEGTFTAIGTSANAWNWAFAALEGNVDNTSVGGSYAADIGTGGSPISNLSDFVQTITNAEVTALLGGGRRTSITASTALQLRAQSSGTDTETKYYALYGIYGTPTPAKQSGNMSGGMQ